MRFNDIYICNLEDIRNSDILQILFSIKAFPALKRLCLKMFRRNYIFSFEAFKGLSNITHLTVFCNYLLFKEKTLKDIDIILPNLQYLVFVNHFILNREEVTQMADILSRLSKLKSLKFQILKQLDYNEIEVMFREKCKNLQTFKINSDSY